MRKIEEKNGNVFFNDFHYLTDDHGTLFGCGVDNGHIFWASRID